MSLLQGCNRLINQGASPELTGPNSLIEWNRQDSLW